MLTVSEAIRERRSIRRFRGDPVPDEVIYQMLEAARLAPSGTNRQPWRFIVVTDAEERAALRRMCRGQAFLEQAPVVLVCCADLTVYSVDVGKKRYQEFIDYGVTETLSGQLTEPEYWEAQFEDAAKKGLESFLIPAIANTYIAIEHMVLTATALGLGTCWVGAINSKEEVAEFFHLPATTVVVAILPVGYPEVIPPPRPRLSTAEILLRPVLVHSK